MFPTAPGDVPGGVWTRGVACVEQEFIGAQDG